MPEPKPHATHPAASLSEEKPMHTARPASLLVAALALLRQPCSRSRATARLLLERAAETGELTPAEREVCRCLADDMDAERPSVDAPLFWRGGLPAV
ncbi:hypothetical protein Tbd_0724 [Thiobacillus denitrificans ATCC 25259]|uniref:Uncharacterized protein n=2 Tax=Thiobacillus denitrificans TaxID=36861 RepID=Q3SKU5_THIDA|nr:hypothetical protein Tbd_0724 [Thiobacillus denitrificans ATCC 25259]